MATYCAQNMGAGKYTRIRKGFKSATLIGFIYAVVTGVIIFFVGKYMTIFFVSENVNQIMEYVDIYLRCVSVSFLPLVIVNLYRNGIQGMGYGLLPMTAGIAELVGRERCIADCITFWQLYGNLSGISGGMGAGGNTSSYYVL